jgi:hypothetical protein
MRRSRGWQVSARAIEIAFENAHGAHRVRGEIRVAIARVRNRVRLALEAQVSLGGTAGLNVDYTLSPP